MTHTEQRRNVTKVEHQLAWGGAWETQISASHAIATDLLSAPIDDLTPTPTDTRCLPPICRHR